MARRRTADKDPAPVKPAKVERVAAPVRPTAPVSEPEDGIAGPRALAFSHRMATPSEYLRALLVVAVVLYDKYTQE